jgi:micrococcal nuclease
MRARPGIIIGLLLTVAVVAGLWWLASGTGGTGQGEAGSGVPGAGEPGASGGIPPGASEAVIEYVHDGDTLFLEDGRKVRLLGVDTPEVGERAECYGEEATALLRSLLPEGTRVSVVADVEPLDQYGRSLLFLYTDDATLINLALIEAGAAEAVVLEPNVLLAAELEAAERRAQVAGLGLWGACR